MCQEHVNPGWYPGPERNGRMVCVKEAPERPGRELDGRKRARGVSAHGHLHNVILEVRQCRVRTWLAFGECTIVVPCDNHLDGVGLYAQPCEGIAEFWEVAGVEENVACWERWLCAVHVVGVGDADDADVGERLLSGWGTEGCVHV